MTPGLQNLISSSLEKGEANSVQSYHVLSLFFFFPLCLFGAEEHLWSPG